MQKKTFTLRLKLFCQTFLVQINERIRRTDAHLSPSLRIASQGKEKIHPGSMKHQGLTQDSAVQRQYLQAPSLVCVDSYLVQNSETREETKATSDLNERLIETLLATS